MGKKVPVFKKRVEAFLTSEEGKITKESMLVAGGIIAAASAGSLAAKFVVGGDYSKPDFCGAGTDVAPKSCYSHGNGGNVELLPSSGDPDPYKSTITVEHNHHYNHGSHASHSSHSSHGSGGMMGVVCIPEKREIKKIKAFLKK